VNNTLGQRNPWEDTNVSVARGPRRIRGVGTTAYPWREDHGVSVARGPQRNRGAGTTAVIYIYIYIYICLFLYIFIYLNTKP
jgi:hypothetical protein